MKYHFGKYGRTAKGTVKVKPFKANRIHYYDTIEIDDYWWNERRCMWESNNDVWDEDGYIKSNDYISCKGMNCPHSFKAFNRYVQKLIKEYDFPKGTVIKLSGRFVGIFIYCIV